jgi:hypothetical protein
MSIRTVVHKLILAGIVMWIPLTSSASGYPDGTGCDKGQKHIDKEVVAKISNEFMQDSIIGPSYDVISQFWTDIPSASEARNWWKREDKIQEEYPQGGYPYYALKVRHTRTVPFPSDFCGVQHLVRLTLPDSDADSDKEFKTQLGIVRQKKDDENYYHTVFSRQGFQKMYDAYAQERGLDRKSITRVELLTAGKQEGVARWAIMSFYLIYTGDGKEGPDFYAIEAAKATGTLPLIDGKPAAPGDPGSTFYMAPAMDKSICDPAGCPHGYKFTPFSNEHNYYRTDLGLNGDELSHVNVESFTSTDSAKPYFYLSGRFDPLTLNDDSQMINGTALHMEAVFRTFSLANSFGLDIVESLEATGNIFEDVGIQIGNHFLTLANAAIRLLGVSYNEYFPWYQAPPLQQTAEAKSWVNSSLNLSGFLKNSSTDFPTNSVNACNAVYADYGTGVLFEASGSNWVEFSPHSTYAFQETHRDEWSVYLEDPSRGVELQVDFHTDQIFYSDKSTPKRPQYKIIEGKRDPDLPEKAFDGPGYVSGITATDTRQNPPVTWVYTRQSSVVGGGANKGQFYWTANDPTSNGVVHTYEESKQSSERYVVLYYRPAGVWLSMDLQTKKMTYIDKARTKTVIGLVNNVDKSCVSRM